MRLHSGNVGARMWLTALLALAIDGCGGSDDSAEATQAAEEAESKQLADHTAGKACKSDKECANGSCQREVPAFPSINREAQPAPGGFCSFPCRINADCGEGSFCIGAGNNAFSFETPDNKGLCLASCNADTPCRDGYTCLDLFGQLIGSAASSGATEGSCQPEPPSDAGQ